MPSVGQTRYPSWGKRAPRREELAEFLRQCWERETSYDPTRWSPDNRAWGQCAVTALIVQDLLGGDLLRGSVNGVEHYWNRLPDLSEVDLTRHQFGHSARAQEPSTVLREYVLGYPDTRRRYDRLVDIVLKKLETQPATSSPRRTQQRDKNATANQRA